MTSRQPIDMNPSDRFDSVFADHHADIYRYCARRLGPVDGEDATADVFAVAWRRLDEVPGDGATRAWLLGVAYRIVGNQYRSRARRTRLTDRLAAVREGVSPIDGDPGLADDVSEVLSALDSLGRDDRELLIMSAWDGLSRDEIASVLEISMNAVDQRMHRARVRLKNRLDGRLRPLVSKEERLP